MTDFLRSLRQAKASVLLQHAMNPLRAERTDLEMGGDGKSVTKEMVEEEFGPSAAGAWAAITDMKTAYWHAVEFQLEMKEECKVEKVTSLSEMMVHIRKIADEDSRTGKQLLLKEMADTPLGRWVIEKTYNPFITYGIKCPLPDKCAIKPGEVTISYSSASERELFARDIEELLDGLAKRELTGNDARDDLLHVMRSINEDGKQMLWRIISKDFKAGVGESSIHLIDPTLVPSFAVMRAQAFTSRRVKEWPYNAEWKLDGQRNTFLCKDGVGAYYTRTGRHVPALDFFVPTLLKVAKIAVNDPGMKPILIDENGGLSFALDGEAMMGLFAETGALRRKGVDAIGSEFHCYDIMTFKDFDTQGVHGKIQNERRKDVVRFANIARQVLKHTDEDGMIQVVPMRVVNSEEEVFQMFETSQETTLASYLARGDEVREAELLKTTIDNHTGKPKVLEGVMVKNPNAQYQKKKCVDWLKVKAEETEDLRIIGAYPGKPGTKYEGSLGGVVVDFNGVHVRVGGGFSDPERESLWEDFSSDLWGCGTMCLYQEKDAVLFPKPPEDALLIGRLLEVAYHEVTPDLSMRHPRAVRFRDDKDSEIDKS